MVLVDALGHAVDKGLRRAARTGQVRVHLNLSVADAQAVMSELLRRELIILPGPPVPRDPGGWPKPKLVRSRHP